jgi:hypothetical protein
MSSFCIVCSDDIAAVAFGTCNHRDQCARCYLIGLKQYGRNCCITCKLPFENAIITSNFDRHFQDFDISKLQRRKEFENTYFTDKREATHFAEMFSPCCPDCRQAFRKLAEVKAHVKSAHDKVFCNVCLTRRKGVLLFQQRLYNSTTLKVCLFCKLLHFADTF